MAELIWLIWWGGLGLLIVSNLKKEIYLYEAQFTVTKKKKNRGGGKGKQKKEKTEMVHI